MFNTRFLTLLILLLLSGCGSGSGSDSSASVPTEPSEPGEPVQEVVVAASDVSTAVYANETSKINLAQAVSSSDNSKPVLADVVSLSATPECDNVSMGELDFTVNVDHVGTCVYQYQVTDAQNTSMAKATTQVAVSGEQAPLVGSNSLPTLSEAIEIGETITVALTAPENMTLSSDVTVLGSGLVTDVDTIGNTITYQADASDAGAGITRLYYYYVGDQGLVRMGIVDIAVSTDTLNRAPNALDWDYLVSDDQVNGAAYSVIKEGELITIDVENVMLISGDMGSLVSDADTEDTLQLVNLSAANSEAELVDPQDPTNMRFTFSTSRSGIHYVTYVVSDQKGGYGLGVITIHVKGTWPDVIIEESGVAIKAPLSLQAATMADYDIAGVAQENSPTDNPPGNGYQNVPTYTWEAANAICRAQGGALPTLQQANDFLTQEMNPYTVGDGNEFEMASNWPVTRSYFTSQKNGESEVWTLNTRAGYLEKVNTGADGQSEPYLGYLMCVDLTPQSLEINNSMLIKGAQQQLTASFQTVSGSEFDYTKPLYWSVSAPDNGSLQAVPDIENNVTLDKYSGEFLSTEAGWVNITAQSPTGELVSSKDIEVIDNLLAVGADPTFESFAMQSETCVAENANDGNGVGFHYWGSFTMIAYGCESQGSYVRPQAVQGDKYLALEPRNSYASLTTIVDNTPLNLTAGQAYRLSFWFYYNAYGGNGSGGLRYFSIINEQSSTVHSCRILDGYDTVNPDNSLVFTEGTGAIDEWTHAQCDFTPSESVPNARVRVLAYNHDLFIDDMMLVPIVE